MDPQSQDRTLRCEGYPGYAREAAKPLRELCAVVYSFPDGYEVGISTLGPGFGWIRHPWRWMLPDQYNVVGDDGRVWLETRIPVQFFPAEVFAVAIAHYAVPLGDRRPASVGKRSFPPEALKAIFDRAQAFRHGGQNG